MNAHKGFKGGENCKVCHKETCDAGRDICFRCHGLFRLADAAASSPAAIRCDMLHEGLMAVRPNIDAVGRRRRVKADALGVRNR